MEQSLYVNCLWLHITFVKEKLGQVNYLNFLFYFIINIFLNFFELITLIQQQNHYDNGIIISFMDVLNFIPKILLMKSKIEVDIYYDEFQFILVYSANVRQACINLNFQVIFNLYFFSLYFFQAVFQLNFKSYGFFFILEFLRFSNLYDKSFNIFLNNFKQPQFMLVFLPFYIILFIFRLLN